MQYTPRCFGPLVREVEAQPYDNFLTAHERKANGLPPAELVTVLSQYVSDVSTIVEKRREELDALGAAFQEDIKAVPFDVRQAIATVSPALQFVGATHEQKVAESDRRTDRDASYDAYLQQRQRFDAFYARWQRTKGLIDRLLIAYKVHTSVGDMSDEARRVPRALFGQDILTAQTSLISPQAAPSSSPQSPININDLVSELMLCSDDASAVMGDAFWSFNYGIRRLVRELSVAFPYLEKEEAA